MAAPPEPQPCAGCGATVAPFGFSRRNRQSLPKSKQKTVWTCGKPECKARGENWKARADGELNPLADRAARDKPAPAQAALF